MGIKWSLRLCQFPRYLSNYEDYLLRRLLMLHALCPLFLSFFYTTTFATCFKLLLNIQSLRRGSRFIVFLHINLRRIFVERSVIVWLSLIVQLCTFPFSRRCIYSDARHEGNLRHYWVTVCVSTLSNFYLPTNSPFKPKSIGTCSDLISIPKRGRDRVLYVYISVIQENSLVSHTFIRIAHLNIFAYI